MTTATKEQQTSYTRLLKKHRPNPPVLRNALAAFITGGAISAIGQVVMSFFLGRGLLPAEATVWTAGAMIFLGSLLTAIGVYDLIGRWGGMGAALPITGFANAVVSPAMDFRREGWVLGLGAKMFVIAGPVIVFGVVTSVVVGLARILLWGVR
ncbi:MAG TPA: SpoVA/SpoVAEb family sporulation membrane protein [Bacillota bacterium]|jgi:stage V sporulation protein AC